MRYIIDISSEKVQEINDLVRRGRYRDVQQFVMAAIDNQLYIERSEIETGDVREKPKDILFTRSTVSLSDISLPSLLTKSGGHYQTVPEPSPVMITLPYLWGQYNRVFPVKLTLRVLLSALKAGASFAPLQEIQEAATNVARKLGNELRKRDREEERKSGQKLSIGLPIGRDMSKAISRFRAHFVGYLATDGRIWGAPSALHFTNIVRDQKGHEEIGVTEAGCQFALLKNPIMDENDFRTTLSEEERDYCLKHIFETLRGEAEAVRLILVNIAKGINTRESLNDVVRGLDEGWSPETVNTMRAGLVSRLDELGLLARKKHGLNVTYQLTPEGQKFAALP